LELIRDVFLEVIAPLTLIFDLLNNCNIPVLFIINKAFNDEDDGKTKDINASISFFKRNNYNNLTKKQNYIGVNIVKSGRIECFGVNEVFERINQIYKENNKFNKETKNKIKQFVKNYHSEILKENDEINNKLAKDINILKEELDKTINMFKYLNIDSIIESGKKPAIRCKNVINSLNNISEIMNIFENDKEKNFSAISFFQAFMVKEIGEIFGYNTSEMTYGIRLYLTQINRQFDKENYSRQAKSIIQKLNLLNLPAVGVIWFDDRQIHPVVYVKDIDTLFYENSCGSGSIAYGIYHAYLENKDGLFNFDVVQKNKEIVKVFVEIKDKIILSAKLYGQTKFSF